MSKQADQDHTGTQSNTLWPSLQTLWLLSTCKAQPGRVKRDMEGAATLDREGWLKSYEGKQCLV